MRAMFKQSPIGRTFFTAVLALGSLCASVSHAAVPGISGGNSGPNNGPVFNLQAAEMYSNQPDGRAVYSWGYGCTSAPAGFLPGGMPGNCPTAQMPGPTLIVHEGDTVTVNLTNSLPGVAGNTSILFPGFQVVTSGGDPGGLTQEAPNATKCPGTTCNTVTYTFTATSPGTYAYYSGTQGAVQVEMGLYGAVVVLPTNPPATCTPVGGDAVRNAHSEKDLRLSSAAYDVAGTCYDREYLNQLAEMDLAIHTAVEDQVTADKLNGTSSCQDPAGCLQVATEPYVATYYLINGRSFPDDVDPAYASQYPNQPYNANPHAHPGELLLLRVIGQGRMQHPFHEHGNHMRVIARDGQPLLTQNGKLAGPLQFTTTSTPGQSVDSIFQWTGKGLNWDAFGHGYAGDQSQCVPDANGYYTLASNPPAPAAAINYYEWCGDHNKALEKYPGGQVASGGPMTLPDPNTVVNGAWYSGTPYLGADAAARSVGSTPLPPYGTVANSPATEAGYAYMWHSHNEREITTANVFPGGMMSMLLVDPRSYAIDESN